MELNHRPHAYQACALTIWAMSPYLEFLTMVLHLRAFTLVVNVPFFKSTLKNKQWTVGFPQESSEFLLCSPASWLTHFSFSLERRWSSRTFWYGYLVTTSPQSLILPSTAASLQLAHRLRVFPTLMVWRAVCTRPGNVFTAVCWPAITSNSDFMKANFSLQSELRLFLEFCFISLCCFSLSQPL